ncbi:MAG TPA: hypothetical protein VMD99_13275 [Terriglobales bacterium]|nr:hypothetical protein [Terriglobales bacterium]
MSWSKSIVSFSPALAIAMLFTVAESMAQQSSASGALSPVAQINAAAPARTEAGARSGAPSDFPDSPGLVASESATKQWEPAEFVIPYNSQYDSPIALAALMSETQTEQSQTQAPPPPVQKPVGTAAAGTPIASGIAASQPAGVAIAPARQHRVRTIVLRTGAIIGAAIAVGTVVALTAATPSKPPGAH